MKRDLELFKPLILAVVASCLSVGMAQAQPALKGTFTLPFETRWGQAVLPAGEYSITMEHLQGAAVVSSLNSGGKRVFVAAQFTADVRKDQPSALLITRNGNERTVRSFNSRETNQTFVYSPLTKEEKTRLAKGDETQTVPILMAAK